MCHPVKDENEKNTDDTESCFHITLSPVLKLLEVLLCTVTYSVSNPNCKPKPRYEKNTDSKQARITNNITELRTNIIITINFFFF